MVPLTRGSAGEGRLIPSNRHRFLCQLKRPTSGPSGKVTSMGFPLLSRLTRSLYPKNPRAPAPNFYLLPLRKWCLSSRGEKGRNLRIHGRSTLPRCRLVSDLLLLTFPLLEVLQACWPAGRGPTPLTWPNGRLKPNGRASISSTPRKQH